MRTEHAQTLAAYDWRQSDKCFCSGILTWKYKSVQFPFMELRYWPSAGKFKILYKGTTIKAHVTSILKLETTLQKLKQEQNELD